MMFLKRLTVEEIIGVRRPPVDPQTLVEATDIVGRHPRRSGTGVAASQRGVWRLGPRAGVHHSPR